MVVPPNGNACRQRIEAVVDRFTDLFLAPAGRIANAIVADGIQALTHCYQVNDGSPPSAAVVVLCTARSRPEGGFMFCFFNATIKIRGLTIDA